eukprot:3440641-Alexandrium_andersonii.AAC.1
MSRLPQAAEACLPWIGRFLGNAAHLLHGNGGGYKGGKGGGGGKSDANDKADHQPSGHNPAWQSWMPRAYQEQKAELEKFKKAEEEVKQRKACLLYTSPSPRD